tara:strand:- start:343 stop:573 length:231 start_codon:yes stop_codon:yes gene_type:complete
MPRRRHESLGDYISSACFGGVAFMAFVNGFEAFSSGNTLRSIAIWVISFFLFLAVFRYPIARAYDDFRKFRFKEKK